MFNGEENKEQFPSKGENKEEGSWRDNWFVKNVLAAPPILGVFFRMPSAKKALLAAFKELFMLAGGTAGMILAMEESKKNESMTTHTAEMVGGMVAGMFAGHVGFNLFSEAGKKISDCCSSSEEEAKKPLLPK